MPKPSLRTRLLSYQIDSTLPLVGAAIRRSAAQGLIRAARGGDGEATRILAESLAQFPDGEIGQSIRDGLARLTHPSSRDALWAVWQKTRHPELERLAIQIGEPASENSDFETRLLSALKLGQVQFASRIGPSRLPLLLAACRDGDPAIDAAAREAAGKLSNARTIKALCYAWVSERSALLTDLMIAGKYTTSEPPAVKMLTRLLQNPADLQIDTESVVSLVAALSDPMPEIAARAGYAIRHLQDKPVIDKLCALWEKDRNPDLGDILIQSQYTASAPPELRLLTILKTGQVELARASLAKWLPLLLEAAHNNDAAIRETARAALQNLKRKDSREALCELAITDEPPLARELAVMAGYRPENPEACARFLFLTGQWEAYENLDFDQRLMRAIYEISSTEVRQKIARQIQTSGRTSYLSILAGVDYRSPTATITEEEAQILIHTLAENQEWERLWGLTQALALPQAVQIVRLLAQNQWIPASEADAITYRKLVLLLQSPIALSKEELGATLGAVFSEELEAILPAALPLAKLKVTGRVNAVAFAPDQPHLAIGVSARKVVRWDYQHGQIVKLINGFGHSVGQVAFTDDGTLVCGERTNNSSICAIYAQRGDALVRLGEHNGSVTGLDGIGAQQALSAGRDGRLILWNVEKGQKVAETSLSNNHWARSMAVSPSQNQAVMLYEGIQSAALPSLELSPTYAPLPIRIPGANTRKWESSMLRQAVFTPDEAHLIVGYNNGRVVQCQGLPRRGQKYQYRDLSQINSPVSGLQFIPEHDVLVMAWDCGEMEFWRKLNPNTRRRSYSPIGRITSLHISPDGAFMATGSDEASLMLWDLRTYDIPEIFRKPLAGVRPGNLPGIMALAQSENLPPSVQNALRFLQILLEQRFRYDIQLSEIAQIQPGDYDIIIEEDEEA